MGKKETEFDAYPCGRNLFMLSNNYDAFFTLNNELFIPFSFSFLTYQVTQKLCNTLFTFLLFFKLLSCPLSLQDAKTEHMEMKILKPITYWYFGSFDKKRTYENM